MEWPFEDAATAPIRWQQPRGLGQSFPEAGYALSQHPIYGTISPIPRIHGCRNQGLEKVRVPLTVTSSDSLGKDLAFCSLDPKFCCPSLGSKEESSLCKSHNKTSFELEAPTSPWSLYASNATKPTD